MSESKHTPGPWLIREPDNGIYDTDDDIANVVARGPYGLITIAEEVDVADARLIAAAPDLLSVAKRWLALDSGSWAVDRHAAEKAQLEADTRAALAAAEGRSDG